jgi:transcriptional regulator with XRE-family HTH domain
MIGDRIKEARTRLGYSAEQVAAFLGVSPATVYRYENGDISKLPSKFIKPLADYLCVTPSYLMGWSEDSPTTEPEPEPPKTDDVRLLIRGLNKLSPEQIEQAKNVFLAMFKATNPDLFDEGDDDK